MKKLLRIETVKVLLLMVPFVYYATNLQYFILFYFSETLSQIAAYLMAGFGLVGYFLMVLTEPRLKKPKLINIWLVFFLVYWTFGLLANALNNYEAPFLKAAIPLIFFLAYSEYFTKASRVRLFLKLSLGTLTLANVALIFFQKINFSIDHAGIYEYELNRAGGVYGDANNAALVCLIAFVLLVNFWRPSKLIHKVGKWLAIAVACYGLFLAFSKTGIVILLFILFIQQFKNLNGKRVLVLFVILPLTLVSLVQFGRNSDMLNDVQKERLENVVNIITLNVDKIDASHRDDLLLNMFDYIFKSPIIGNGIYFSTDIRGHNTIIGVWADAGILAFVIFLFLLINYFNKAILSPPTIRVFSLSILAILVIYMLTLQTVINQIYLLPFFIYISYLLDQNYGYLKEDKLQL